MLLYNPLEASLSKLEKFAKEGNVREFDKESINFYKRLPVLKSYRSWMGEQTINMVEHYQQRYDQIKMFLRR